MGFAEQLLTAVTQRPQEVVVSTQHLAIEVKFDHGHGAFECSKQSFVFGDFGRPGRQFCFNCFIEHDVPSTVRRSCL